MTASNPKNSCATPASSSSSHTVPQAPLLALLATLALATIAYWPGLHGPLVFDDGPNLEPINDWLQGNVGWMSIIFDNDSGLLGRPLSMACFLANVALLGPDSWGLKLGNLLIHLTNGILVFALFNTLSRQGALSRNSPRPAPWLALFGASIWLLHPLLASTVLYVVQRMAMLSALFTLLTMLAYLRGRASLIHKHRKSAFFFLLFVAPLCTILASLSKENGVLAPPLCAFIELIVFRPAPNEERPWQSKAFIATTLAIPAIIALILVLTQSPLIVAGYTGRSFTLNERLLTEARVLWSYVGDLLLPGGTHLGFYHDDFPISHNLLSPTSTLPAIAAWVATIIAAWLARNTLPGFALGVGIFLVGHMLESSVFPLMIYFEHRNYLPAIGAIWAVVALIVHSATMLRHQLRRAPQILGVSAIALIIVLAAGTAIRASVWADQRSIVAQALLTHPDSRAARFDSITLALAEHPPAFNRARADADWLRNSRQPNTRRVGAIERLLIDCSSDTAADPHLIREMFDGPPGPLEEDLMRAFENLSDRIGTHSCEGLTSSQMADGLSEMLDRWEPPSANGANWRLRFRVANLYMAADRNKDAIRQAKLAYRDGKVPMNTAIMIAGVLLYCGDPSGAAQILDATEHLVRPSDILARKIILDDRAKIARAQQALH